MPARNAQARGRDAASGFARLHSARAAGAAGRGRPVVDLDHGRELAPSRRAEDERRGQVRWLRPEFQHPTAPEPQQEAIPIGAGGDGPFPGPSRVPAAQTASPRGPWPATLPEQVAAVAGVLAASSLPLSAADVASRFQGRGPWKKRLPQLLETLVVLGRARRLEDGRFSGSR